MKKLLSSLIVSVVLLGVVGCGVVDTLKTVENVYHGGRAYTALSSAREMTKSMNDSEPFINNYDAIKVEVQVFPRDEEQQSSLIEAFSENISYIVEQNLAAIDIRAEFCSESCPAKTLVVQFRESGYEPTLANRIFRSGSMRGDLFFIDSENASIVDTDKIEVGQNYSHLLTFIHTSVAGKVLSAYREQVLAEERDEDVARKKLEVAGEKLVAIDPIMPEYTELFAQN